MRLHNYADIYVQLFDSYDDIMDHEPEINENGEYLDDDGNIIPDIEAYRADMQTAWFDTLDGIETEFEQKAENIACYIEQLEGELAMLERKKAATERRRKAKANHLKAMKSYLLDCMQKIGRTRFETGNVKVTIRNNPEAPQFENEREFIKWAKENAPELLNYGEPKIYKTSVKDVLRSGVDLPGVVLGRTQSLVIK